MGRLRNVEDHLSVLKGDVNTLKTDVAELKGDVHELKGDVNTLKTDVAEIKGAVVQLTQVAIDHSERLDGMQRELVGVNKRLDTLEVLKEQMSGVNDRLDRLIAVTTDERTRNYERQGASDARMDALERRVSKLEERAGPE